MARDTGWFKSSCNSGEASQMSAEEQLAGILRRPLPAVRNALPWHRKKRLASGVRLCMAADIEKFRRFEQLDAGRAQKRFVEALLLAREYAGIREEHVVLQPSGDGQFAILPSGLDGSLVIPRLEEGLWRALRDINRELSAYARIRVRTSLYQGHVRRGPNGWVGHATVAVHRLLDSSAVREALENEPSADFALIVSAEIYRDYILNQQGRMRREDFVEVVVHESEKQFTESARTYAPRR